MLLIIHKARLHNQDGLYDISIDDQGIISKVSSTTAGTGGGPTNGSEEIDARENLVLPSFVNLHFHLDTSLTMGTTRPNESGTLLEGIEIWAERKKKLTAQDVRERASRSIKLMAAHGTTYLRTHADVSDPNLTALKALFEVKEEFKDIMDIQITAFPQDGILTEQGNKELLEKSLEIGADNVGIIPHNEFTREDGVRSIDIAFELAKKYGGKDVDGHVDETDDEQSRFLEVVAAKTIKEGYFGRVTAGHATAMHSYNDAYASKLYRILKRAQMTIIANPLVNIHLQGRFDTYPKRRGMTRVKELLQNGINVALGHDDMMDPFYPLGKGDMVQALFMAVHVAQMMGKSELLNSFDLITTNAAKALRIDHQYGVKKGNPANLVVLDSSNEIEALAKLSQPLYVIKNGALVVERGGYETTINHGGGKDRFDDIGKLLFE